MQSSTGASRSGSGSGSGSVGGISGGAIAAICLAVLVVVAIMAATVVVVSLRYACVACRSGQRLARLGGLLHGMCMPVGLFVDGVRAIPSSLLY